MIKNMIYDVLNSLEIEFNYENIVVQKPSGIDLMEADGFAKLINSLNEHC